VDDVKLFGEWRAKSFIVLAKADADGKDYEKAIHNLKQAQQAITAYLHNHSTPALLSLHHEVKRLMASYIQLNKAVLKKEKLRAQAMFAAPTPTSKTKKSSNGYHTNQQPSPKPNHHPAINGYHHPFNDTIPLPSIFKNTTERLQNPVKKSVTFQGQDYAQKEEWEFDDQNLPWYQQHKEALILTGIGALLACGLAVLQRTRR